MTTGYNNDGLAKRPGSDMDILSVDTENHFDQPCTRWRFQNEVGRWWRFLKGIYVDPTPVSWLKVAKTGAILGLMR